MTEIRVGGRFRYGKDFNAITVTVMELLPGDKARVVYYTAGRKASGKRYYVRGPERREKVVRLTSLREP